MQAHIEVIELKQQLYSFDKNHLLGFDQFHQAILTDKKSVLRRKVEQIKADKLIAIQLTNNLKIYLLTRLNDQQFERKLILTNPLGLKLVTDIKQKLFNNKSIIENFDFTKGFQNCLQQTADKNPDLLVQDIYGKDSSSIGLPEKLLACSLGKLSRIPEQKFESKQIIRSLVMAFAINTAQISGLISKKYKIPEIIILKNQINGLSFHRLIYVAFNDIKTLLNYYSPESNLYVNYSFSQ